MKNLFEKKVFIVDDDKFWRSTLKKNLTQLGFADVVLFESGNECIDNLHQNPGLVFLDYQMEGMDGLKTLELIKDYFPGIGVIFCTALEDLNVAVDAIKKGSFDYLLKTNADKKEILKVLENLVLMENNQQKVY